jgi:hypothetical protein
MQWNRSNAIGLAKVSCTRCQGLGIRVVRGEVETPCNCVFRAVFRACWNRFRECVALGTYGSSVSLELCNGKDGRRRYSRKREEYMADFLLVTRRTLEEAEHQLFRYHFLLGADWSLCARRLQLDRGTFFHQVYRIEQKLGRTFAELEPFPLFPVDEYFNRPHPGTLIAPSTPSARQLREYQLLVA